ncbi:MAG: hypothetical protein ACRDP5_02245 [Streptosporangiaceae bacterium]
MKNIRLIMSSVAAVAALTATGGYPQAASAQTLSAQTLSAQALSAQALGAQTLGAHSVNWGDVTIPGHLCKVNGPIKLHNGRAFVRHSGFGMALDVLMLTVSRGSLGHGLHVAALQIWCDNTGGTADGELAEGIFVFDSPGGHPHLLGTLTPQLKGNPMLHIPFIVVNRIETTGHVAVTESFYNSVDPTCCPSGHATTLWKWTGRTFIPGRTHITST